MNENRGNKDKGENEEGKGRGERDEEYEIMWEALLKAVSNGREDQMLFARNSGIGVEQEARFGETKTTKNQQIYANARGEGIKNFRSSK